MASKIILDKGKKSKKNHVKVHADRAETEEIDIDRIATLESNVERMDTLDDARPGDDTGLNFDVVIDAGERADIEKAEYLRERRTPHQRIPTPDGGLEFRPHPVCETSPQELEKYGLGVVLYFELLKRLLTLFGILIFLSIPALVFNISASASSASSSGYYLEKTTIGNLADALHSNRTLDQVDILGTDMAQETIGLLESIFDALGCVIVLYSTYKLGHNVFDQSYEYLKSQLSIVNYTVKVTGLPPRFQNRFGLAKFFERLVGPVADVVLVYNDDDILRLYVKRGELRRDLSAARVHARGKLKVGETHTNPEIRTLRNKIRALDAEIEAVRRRHGPKKTVAAFVSFENAIDKHRCIQMYPKGWWSKCMMGPKYRLNGHRIQVEQAFEPSNIKYENLKYDKCDLRCRRIASACIYVCIILVSVLVVYVAQQEQRQTPQTAECPIKTISAAEANADDFLVGCYCDDLGTTISDPENVDCEEWNYRQYWSQLLTIISVATIILTNVVLKWATSRLGEFEKHHSRTEEQSSVSSKLFLGLFLNTGIVLLLVNANLDYHVGYVGFKLAFDGEYSDMTADWYDVVGVSIILTLALNIVMPHLYPFMQIKWDQWKREDRCVPSWCCFRMPRTTQTELDAVYEGRFFNLAERYAVLLNTMFVTLLYSSCLPLVYCTAFLTYACTYWMDKASFLRLYAIPPRYDHELTQTAIDMVPWAMLLHLAMGIWVFTSPVVSTHELDQPSVTDTIDSYDVLGVGERLYQWSAIPQLILFVVLLVHVILKHTCGYLCGTSEDDFDVNAEIANEGHVIPYSEAIHHEECIIESYHVHMQHNYVMAFVRTPSHRQLSIEYELADAARYKRKKKKRRAKKQLRKRKRKIEAPDAGSFSSSEDEELSSTEHKSKNHKKKKTNNKNTHRRGNSKSVSTIELAELPNAPDFMDEFKGGTNGLASWKVRSKRRQLTQEEMKEKYPWTNVKENEPMMLPEQFDVSDSSSSQDEDYHWLNEDDVVDFHEEDAHHPDNAVHFPVAARNNATFEDSTAITFHPSPGNQLAMNKMKEMNRQKGAFKPIREISIQCPNNKCMRPLRIADYGKVATYRCNWCGQYCQM